MTTTLQTALAVLEQDIVIALNEAYSSGKKTPLVSDFIKKTDKEDTSKLIENGFIAWAALESQQAADIIRLADDNDTANEALTDIRENLSQLFATAYLVAEYQEDSDGKRLINVEYFDDVDAAKAYCNNHAHEDYLKEIINITLKYLDSSIEIEDDHASTSGNATVVINIEAIFNDEVVSDTFSVQTCGGFYLPQMGCLITADYGSGDVGFTEQEKILMEALDLADIAKNAYSLYEATNVTYHDVNFNVALSGNTAAIREKDGTFTILIVDSGFNTNDYNFPYYVSDKTFDSLEEANAYIDQFRTDDFNDASGLKALFDALHNYDEYN